MAKKETTADFPMPHHNIKDVRVLLSKNFVIIPKYEDKIGESLSRRTYFRDVPILAKDELYEKWKKILITLSQKIAPFVYLKKR